MGIQMIYRDEAIYFWKEVLVLQEYGGKEG